MFIYIAYTYIHIESKSKMEREEEYKRSSRKTDRQKNTREKIRTVRKRSTGLQESSNFIF